jgi:transcriptional regulator with XRE-family HTH domain
MQPTTKELLERVAQAARELRLSQNLTQLGLGQRSGVALATIKKFERTGQISLESLLKIAIALGSSASFESLFATDWNKTVSLDELIEQTKPRKRGRLK